MKKLAIATLFAIAATASLADNPHGLPPGIARKLAACEDCGHVTSVHSEKRKGEGGMVGIVGGAAAGGYAGNEVQKHVNSRTVWITKVEMKDGSTRTFEQEAQPAWKAGSVVKLHGKGLAAI